jgi:hypothetical protein
VIIAAVLALALIAAPAVAQPVPVPSPTVIGPIPAPGEPGNDPDHDYVFFTPMFDLADYGYVEEEFFIEGTANRYDTPAGQTGSVISSGHPYKTRIVVRRPTHPNKFNGVVILEWQNVSGGFELDAHWAPSWDHMMDRGYAWVGVSAQRVGVHGYGYGIPGIENGLIDWSPLRYGTLDVTVGGTILDDSLCYDVYAQAAQAVRNPAGIDPMDGLEVEMVLAVGASQSAGRLSVYHNSIHPLHEVMDGFYLLVGGAGLRTDLDVKVFQYLSETDMLGGPARRMADSDVFRGWEVAGTGHSSYVSEIYRGPLELREFGERPFPPAVCALPTFARPPSNYVINQQYDLLVRWLEQGVAPPTAPKLEFESVDPPVMARNELGLALGGIQLSDIAVPIALNNGVNFGGPFCGLYGTYQPFDDELLRELYPNHGDYVSAVAQSEQGNLMADYITLEGARETKAEAAMADVPPAE